MFLKRKENERFFCCYFYFSQSPCSQSFAVESVLRFRVRVLEEEFCFRWDLETRFLHSVPPSNEEPSSDRFQVARPPKCSKKTFCQKKLVKRSSVVERAPFGQNQTGGAESLVQEDAVADDDDDDVVVEVEVGVADVVAFAVVLVDVVAVDVVVVDVVVEARDRRRHHASSPSTCDATFFLLHRDFHPVVEQHGDQYERQWN